METSRASTLPTFKIGDIYETAIAGYKGEQKVVEIVCPRSWCDHTFVVVIKDWWAKNIWETRKEKRGVKLRTRACPYCFGVAKRPKRPKG